MQQVYELQQTVAAAGVRPLAIQHADIDALMREVARLRLENAGLQEGQRAIEARQAAEREQMLAAQAETNRRAQEVAQRNAILEQERQRAQEAEFARQRALLPPPPPRYPAPVFPADWQEGMGFLARMIDVEELVCYLNKTSIDQLCITYKDVISSLPEYRAHMTKFYEDTERALALDNAGNLLHSDPAYWRVYLITGFKKGIFVLPSADNVDLTQYKGFS